MTHQDYENLKKILDRASDFNPVFKTDRTGLMMDLEFTNETIPLDFERLANADDGNFIHDVAGIYKHFDRATKTMGDLFVPRYAKQNANKALMTPEEIVIDRETFLKSEIERIGWLELDSNTRHEENEYHDQIGDLMAELEELQKTKKELNVPVSDLGH